MTPLERLKMLAAAKKADQSQEEKKDETSTVGAVVSPTSEGSNEAPVTEGKEVVHSEAEPKQAVCSAENERLPDTSSSLSDDHPLKMQLAELEQALTQKLPEFRTILRDIHAKLRQDPDCVTAMSEDEIGVIVEGLIHHANVEVIAPKAIKAAKKAAKTPVSASDL